MIFIIGESGCGKSTFCKIMERAYELETGEILLNGKDDLRGTAIEKWRENIGVVPQDVFIFGIKEQMDTITNRYNKWLYLFHISSC